jgi:hypothetical protein
MPYSYSTHFSEQISYKILFISSYGLKDMNLASFAQNLKFLENREYAETILTEKQLAKEDDNRTGAADEWDRPNRKQSQMVRVLPLIEFEP